MVCLCLNAQRDVYVSKRGRLRLREVVGDEVRALEEQKYVTQTLTLQGAVQGDPVSILGGGEMGEIHSVMVILHLKIVLCVASYPGCLCCVRVERVNPVMVSARHLVL